MDLPYGMYDMDNHLYETTDALTRHLPSSRSRDLFWMQDERGHRHLVLNGKVWDYITNPTFDPISKAGSLTDMFAGRKSKDQVFVDGLRVVEPLSIRPEYLERDARIARLDEQRVDACVLFPTLASGIEEYTRTDLALQHDVLWSYARWLDEEWGFAYQDRLYTAPIISMSDVDGALEMLDWVLERGCRVVDMRPAPIATALGSKSPGDPMFDPFWARCAEAGVLVCSHLGESGYYKYSGDWTGKYERRHTSRSAFEFVYLHGRPITDFLTALVCHGVFTRHPKLRIVAVENGSDWLPYLMDNLKTYYQRYPGEFPEDPIEAVRRNLWISPFWEERLDELAEYLPLDHIVAGSDFPHPEGLAEPTDFVKGLGSFDPAQQRLIMRDNLKALLPDVPRG